MPEILEFDLMPQMRNLLELLWEEWKIAEQQIGVLSHELERIGDADAGCSRVQQIPGIVSRYSIRKGTRYLSRRAPCESAFQFYQRTWFERVT